MHSIPPSSSSFFIIIFILTPHTLLHTGVAQSQSFTVDGFYAAGICAFFCFATGAMILYHTESYADHDAATGPVEPSPLAPLLKPVVHEPRTRKISSGLPR